MQLLTAIKNTLADLLRTLRDEVRDDTRPAFERVRNESKPLVIYTAEPRHEGWVVARRGTWIFGPWPGDSGRERALQMAQRLNQNQAIRLAHNSREVA